ncbi:MAG: cytochrome c [Rhizobiales bacterium]|nr:cytochrome c [Hyphomicrobiales bacterium]
MHRISAALLSSLAVVTLANVASAADAGNGEKLARRWCVSCHVVAADQRQGNTQADPFSAMAKLPGLDAGKLALYLLLPHPKMPDMNLSRSEAADLAAYIAKQGR